MRWNSSVYLLWNTRCECDCNIQSINQPTIRLVLAAVLDEGRSICADGGQIMWDDIMHPLKDGKQWLAGDARVVCHVSQLRLHYGLMWHSGHLNTHSHHVWDFTWVVFVFSDLQFDELLALLEDLHSFLHRAVLHPDVIDGQQLVSQLQRSRPENEEARAEKRYRAV